MSSEIHWTMKKVSIGSDFVMRLFDQHGNEIENLISIEQVSGGPGSVDTYKIEVAVTIDRVDC